MPVSRATPRTRRTGLAVALLVVGLSVLGASCRSHSSRIRAFREAYSVGDFPYAESEVDELIAAETHVDVGVVRSSRGLDDAIDASQDDVALLLLEKAMTRLAQGDPDSALDLMRRSRDALDVRFASKDVVGYFQSVLKDDTAIDFAGADYEQLLLRTLLAISDLLLGGQDAFAYALQIDEKQEEILGSDFGEDLEGQGGRRVSYNPREQYQRLAVGAYLQGVVQEAKGFRGEAAKSYARAIEWGAKAPSVEEARAEAAGEIRPPPDTGIVHVLYLGGTGPYLEQGRSEVTDLALDLAKVGAVIHHDRVGLLSQAPVPVPQVMLRHPWVPPLSIQTDGATAKTELLLDVNEVTELELRANMPWIIARAVVRRAVKGVAAKQAGDQVGRKDRDGGLLLELGANLLLTAGERADVRNWTSLPAQIQIARLRLAEGDHWLSFGEAGAAGVHVQKGRASYVVLIQPNLTLPAAILVDVASRPRPSAEPTAVPEPAP